MQAKDIGYWLALNAGMLGVVQGALNATAGKAAGQYGMIVGVSFAQIAVASFLAWRTHAFHWVPVPVLSAMAAAGLLGVFIMFGVSFSTGRIGAMPAFLLVTAGQIAASAVIDHFGLLGAARQPLTLHKAGSVLLIAAGVYGFMKSSQ